ncbi:MAG: tetratricopeptide repeat protein [Actinobacteria bacterium]|nr:MAG: tetratricopeptide repeat protein [Actinomycetota bacterium]
MSRELRTDTRPQAPTRGLRLGERLRQLRVSAGLTQSDLAGDRFSKEYVSQIERGKTRPTRETIDWLSVRLGVDPGFLANGVSTDERGRLEGAVARAEALIEAGKIEEAREDYESLVAPVRASGLPELEVRVLYGTARTLMRFGEARQALELLNQARAIVEGPDFSDVERADVLLGLGICRLGLSSVQTALALFNEALSLAERSGLPCDALRSKILSWRSRCWRHHRDYEAAREDVERALELAEAVQDPRTIGEAYFQASIVADREGHWVLARSYAEKAKSAYEQLTDKVNVGRLTNNLGMLHFLLGKPEQAIDQLKEAFKIALDTGNQADAAQAVSSLAQVHLRTGNPELAEEQVRHALQLLDGREDFLDEIGGSHLVLGRALLEQERLDEAEQEFVSAERCFEQLGNASFRAAAWVARGDLAAKRGDDRTAARLYRNAAEVLQDVRF